MYDRRRIGLVVSLGIAAVLVMTALPARAATITLQESHEWYGAGDTVAYGVYAGDPDGDTDPEIVTVGRVYNGPLAGTLAQMKVWGWVTATGQFGVEKTKEWRNAGTYAAAADVYVGDLDDDGSDEIVTVGYGISSGAYYNELVIWEYVPLTGDYDDVITIGYAAGRRFLSVYATQIDTGDDELEIAVVGEDAGDPQYAILHLFTYDGSISLKASTRWAPNSKDASANGVYAANVDGDGAVEILTAGYVHDSYDVQLAELRVWGYANGALSAEDIDGYTWDAGKDSAVALSVFAADIDSGADVEIVTCGNAIDSTPDSWGDLEAFTHSGSTISPEGTASVWQHSSNEDTECHAVYIGDVDATGELDVVTVGKEVSSGDVYGQVRVWNFDGSSFSSLDTEEWRTTDDTEAHTVVVGDVDPDATVEIVTGGQAYDGTRIRAQMRIWYWA